MAVTAPRAVGGLSWPRCASPRPRGPVSMPGRASIGSTGTWPRPRSPDRARSGFGSLNLTWYAGFNPITGDRVSSQVRTLINFRNRVSRSPPPSTSPTTSSRTRSNSSATRSAGRAAVGASPPSTAISRSGSIRPATSGSSSSSRASEGCPRSRGACGRGDSSDESRWRVGRAKRSRSHPAFSVADARGVEGWRSWPRTGCHLLHCSAGGGFGGSGTWVPNNATGGSLGQPR